MVRADVRDIRPCGAQPPGGHSHLIHIRVLAGNMILPVNLYDLPIARILHTIVFLVSQKLHNQPVQILRSRADHNLIWIDKHSSKRLQMLRNCRPQFPDASGRGCLHQLTALIGDDAPQNFRPYGKGEQLRVHPVIRQIHRIAGSFLRDVNVQGNTALSLHLLHAFKLRHIIPLLRNGINIPFADQLVIGVLNGNGTNTVIFCESPLGRQLFSLLQISRQNVLLYALIYVFVQRPLRLGKVISKHLLFSHMAFNLFSI